MDEYRQLLPYLSGWMRESLGRCPGWVRENAREIRLRIGQPVAIIMPEQVCFLGENGLLHGVPGGCRRVCEDELKECLQKVCGYSMQSCEQELAHGFCTLAGGHRVGIAGTAAAEDGKILSLREVGSLNFRIARQIYGAAGELPRQLYGQGRIPSVLLVGEPGSGKTTVLRDLIRRLSGGECERPLQIAAIDERGELAGGRTLGEAVLDLGPCTDLLSGYPKGLGMEIALRTLAPQILACDEVGGEREAQAVMESVHAGVALLATAHGRSVSALKQRPALCGLLKSGAFDVIVLLSGGKPQKIIRLDEEESG